MSQVLLIKCDNKELYDLYKELENKSSADSGIDLYCPNDLYINSHSQVCINFNISCEIIDNITGENLPYWLVPRSSIVKTPLRMSNSIGLIDQGYRGNIMAYVDNISNEQYFIEKNRRLFQLVSPTLQSMKVKVVDELSSTSRGSGGFGSTGK